MALVQSYVGTSTVGASNLALASTIAYVKKVTLAAGDYLAAVEIYFHTDAGNANNVKPVLYSDNAGVPGMVIGLSDSALDLLKFTATPRWLTFPIGYHTAAGGDFWVGFHSSDATNMGLAYETTGGNDYQVVQGSGWTSEPGAYATATDPGSHLYSIRASVVSGFTATRPGRTTVGGSWLSLTSGVVYLRSITVPADSCLAAVVCYLRHQVANVVTVAGYVWDDNGGVPGKVLMAGPVSDGTSTILLTPGRWMYFPAGIWTTAGATFWVGVQMLGGSSFDLAYDAAGSDGGTKASAGDAAAWTSGSNDWSIHGLVLS